MDTRHDLADDFEHCAGCGAALPMDSRFCQQCEAGKTSEKTGPPEPARRLYKSAWQFAALSALMIEAAPLALWQAVRAWKANEDSETRDTLLTRRIRRILLMSAGLASLSAAVWFFYLAVAVTRF